MFIVVEQKMGGCIRYEFKGETNAVVTRGGTLSYFGRVGCVLGCTHQSQLILRFRDEPDRKLVVSFPDAAVPNGDGTWPLLSMEQPQLDSQVLVLKGLYGGMVGHVVVFETWCSSLVVRLEVTSLEITTIKDGVIQVLGVQDGSWTEEEMALFTPRVRVLNMWSRIKRAKHGHIIYVTPYKYRIRFPDCTRYFLTHDVRLVDQPSPPQALSFGSAPTEPPVKDAEIPVEDASVLPSDVTLGGGESGSEGVSREPSVSSGQGSVQRIVHTCAVYNLGVAMATRSSVAHRSSVASPASVASQAPPLSAGAMVDVMGHLDDLQSTMDLLVGRVAVVEVATQRHTDMAVSINDRFDQLMGLVQGLHGKRGVVFGPPPMGPMGMPPQGPGVPAPHPGPRFPYPYTLPLGPEMVPGHPVSPVSRFKSSLS
jgi:hypothetical protein